MTSIPFNRQQPGSTSRPETAGRLAPLSSLPSYRVLICEYRDEVFARLEADLRKAGHTVFRATQTDELRPLYGDVSPNLVLCHHELSGRSGWIAAATLQMYYAAARVWLYAPWRSAFDPTWIKISCVEDMIYYRGDLFHLADETIERMRHPAPKPIVCRRLHRKSG